MIKLKHLISEYVILEKLKDEIELVPASKEQITPFIQKHYLGKFPTAIKKIYAVIHKQPDGSKIMIGTIIYGAPFMTAGKFLSPVVLPNEILELKRLYIDDINIRNIESFVISQSIKKIKEEMPEIKAVITFADQKQGHVGAIYQATNALYLGQTADGKHKYIYILRGNESDIKKLITQQPYPKKEPQTNEEKNFKGDNNNEAGIVNKTHYMKFQNYQ